MQIALTEWFREGLGKAEFASAACNPGNVNMRHDIMRARST